MDFRRKVINGLVCLLPVMTGGFFCGAFPAAGDTAVSMEIPPLTWTIVPLPADGEAGDWTLAAGATVRCLEQAPDGTMYAGVDGLSEHLFRSSDGGYHWKPVGHVQETVIDIAIPGNDSSRIYYATAAMVYRSTDGGKKFTQFGTSPGGAGTGNVTITALDTTWENGDVVAAATRDDDAGEYGGLYLFHESGLSWTWNDTGLGNFDSCAVAFSPSFQSDFSLAAVITDKTDTWVTFHCGDAGWNTMLPDCRLVKNLLPGSIAAVSAVLALPADFNAMNNPLLYAGISTGTGEGDVYRIAPRSGRQAKDLDAGGTSGYDDIDISGLLIIRQDESTRLVAGAVSQPLMLVSTDSGTSWESAGRLPPGDAVTTMQTGLANNVFTATSGFNAGLSVSHNAGESWNQVSFIDDAIFAAFDMAVSPEYETDGTLFVATGGNGCSLWRSTSGGTSWERLLAGMDAIDLVALPPEYGTTSQNVFWAGVESGQPVVWSSRDGGETFRSRPTIDPATGQTFFINKWAIIDSVSFIAASFDGFDAKVFATQNCGFYYGSGVLLGTNSITSIALSPDYQHDHAVLAADATGWVYYSTDDEEFNLLPAGAAAPPFNPDVSLAFDSDFKNNGIIYAASSNVDEGIWRFRIGKSDSWEEIDTDLPDDALIQKLVISEAGVLYAINIEEGEGMERCLNPAAGVGMTWDTVTRGLPTDYLSWGLRSSGSHIWSADFNGASLIVFHDTLDTPVRLTSPENSAAGLGSLGGDMIRNVRLEWETLSGATTYAWQCADNSDFTGIAASFEGNTSAGSVRLPELEPATTYYWRVRAIAPVHSPWSGARSFTTGMAGTLETLEPGRPASGALDVPLAPLFQWPAVLGATSYELLVDTNANFSSPLITRTGADSLIINAWQCDNELEPGTVYYWKFRARGENTFTNWSSTAVFTTLPLQAEAPLLPASDAMETLTEVTVTATAPEPVPSPDAVASPATTIIVHVPESPDPNPPWLPWMFGGLMVISFLTAVGLVIMAVKVRTR